MDQPKPWDKPKPPEPPKPTDKPKRQCNLNRWINQNLNVLTKPLGYSQGFWKEIRTCQPVPQVDAKKQNPMRNVKFIIRFS